MSPASYRAAPPRVGSAQPYVSSQVKPNRIVLLLIWQGVHTATPRRSNVCTFLSLSVRNVPAMSVRRERGQRALPVDPLTRRLTDILDELAAQSSTTRRQRMPFGLIGLRCWRGCGRLPQHCRRRVGQVRAITGRRAIGCGCATECDRSRHRRTDSPRVSHLSGNGGAPVGYGAGIVVRTAGHL
jgi:hypothetical protein